STRRNSFASFPCALLLPISCIISRSRHAKDVDSDLHHRAVTRSAPDSTRPRLLNARCIGPRAAQSRSWLTTQSTSKEATGLSGQRYRVCMAILYAGARASKRRDVSALAVYAGESAACVPLLSSEDSRMEMNVLCATGAETGC